MAAVGRGDVSATHLRYGSGAVLRRLLSALPGVMLALALLPSGAATALAMGASGGASSALNDQGANSNYRSTITSVTPAVAGLSVQVLEFADRLLLRNSTGKTVTILGYDREPYARVLANGTVERNVRSPATYLNASFYGDINVPAAADANAPPQWEVLDRTGQFEWHDHRIHYTSPAVPPQVKDTGKRTLVFDWKVPIEVGSARGAVDGQLFWEPENSKAPLAAILVGVAIAVGGLALVLFVRRRRAGEGASEGGGPGKEAW